MLNANPSWQHISSHFLLLASCSTVQNCKNKTQQHSDRKFRKIQSHRIHIINSKKKINDNPVTSHELPFKDIQSLQITSIKTTLVGG
jgi:G:T/U-mismatch repair DNA glycosylase